VGHEVDTDPATLDACPTHGQLVLRRDDEFVPLVLEPDELQEARRPANEALAERLALNLFLG